MPMGCQWGQAKFGGSETLDGNAGRKRWSDLGSGSGTWGQAEWDLGTGRIYREPSPNAANGTTNGLNSPTALPLFREP